jgi:ATP-dependent exoDNAse (exonuclease V) alpha subunit
VNYVIDKYVQKAIDCIDKGEPITYLCGKAGVGKSSFIRHLKQTTTKNIVVVAPTGIAALNAGGQTINSFFRFPPKIIEPHKDIKPRNDEVIDALELLIIDEISMVRADTLDCINHALRKWKNPNKLFGGVQVLMVGDCFQIPPVVPKDHEYLFKMSYKSPWFFHAKVFEMVPMKFVEMKKSYRQSDQKFKFILNNIRNRINIEQTCRILNKFCYDKEVDQTLCLTTTRMNAAITNRHYSDQLTTPVVEFKASREGDIKLNENNLPVPESLKLKIGSRVMIKKNTKGAVNGSLGIITDMSEENKTVNVTLDTGISLKVEYAEWEMYKYVYSKTEKKITAEVVGVYRQMPLVLGWAVTIHSAQGLTLESVELDTGYGCFASGQLYVALSRCKTMEKLSLTRFVKVDDVILDENVVNFYIEHIEKEGD